MKHRLVSAAAAAILALGAHAAHADYKLTILHTNDFHSRIEPINKYDSTCDQDDLAAAKCFGGSARLLTAIRAARQTADNPILVDGGDQFQGTLFYTTYKGKAAAEMMNAIGYEAMTVGNHEFDDGPEVLTAFIKAVDFPVLLANADVSQEPGLAGVVKRSVVIEKKGEKIGLLGVSPADTDELSSPGKKIRFSDPVEALTREVKALTDTGVDKIILLSHSGYSVDKRIAAEVPGIDVIVGGHSHSLLSNIDAKAEGPYPTMVKGPDGHDVPIVQAYAYGKYLGELEVTFDEKGVVTAASGQPLIMDGEIAEDSTLKQRVAELAKPLEAIRKEVVAETASPIDGSKTCRIAECPMGDLVADAMLQRVKDQGITIAITNGGGLRASIDAGKVTMGEVLTVLPFQNTLSTFRLKGSDVKAALENGVSKVEEGAGRFPQVAGLKFAWKPAAAPGSRIAEVMVKENGKFVPLDPDKVYGVVSNNYMRSGGDGYAVFEEKASEAYDFGPALDEVVANYLAGRDGPYEPFTDGRITSAN
ncbi:multifunctional 2',3'-cyclic-nucleotide 2'-phosphodiesterase/5'-nucleotidase/3'-nucleotidase [Jiella endophytica]|uniref:Multifunctional 2',3'-cyclic-nucleotide 2'-phosphodiesterase/5'-nucleotidase/3'-nucleotidase n=1 Tax=Jiella endophytica TaxID=2558362 RepID=A0A4Y8RGP7_9HYPH|nr:bifunctional metallophosphatase/5'-nucleotidase [Jiella endophytica]TFF21899.1 multifunctional 2',3'-cyclic-nucleotide 2'-phosphodiesterase/5'-nucleotidase/3'-nucleotidase [Jiella endophytica]